MRILVTGANGYIGTHLIPGLLAEGHEVICTVRDRRRFTPPRGHRQRVSVVEADFLEPNTLQDCPPKVDVAFYLIHSMGSSARDFPDMEQRAAKNFADYMARTDAKQIVYLSGIVNDGSLSKHLQSRMAVEDVLRASGIPLTVLRAAIIIGSGSASFEILRDLVEKLPLMITPRWVKTRCQPIAISDVIFYLNHVMLEEDCFDRSFDIGGPDVLTYREMMLAFARVRQLKRAILTVPVLTPRLSSFWLHFITSTNISLARSLVDSMKNEVICGDQTIDSVIDHQCLSYEAALRRAFKKIENNQVLASWKDSVVSGNIRRDYLDFVQVPDRGVYRDVQTFPIHDDPDDVRDRVWSVGGKNGWYTFDWAWKLRGVLDQLVGGVGLRRGRRDPQDLKIGDALDFWRVLLTNKQRDRLVLFAEMKLPGEAWLEWRIDHRAQGYALTQVATFRPRGLLGRVYWWSLVPIHIFIFKSMAKSMLKSA